MDPFRAENSAPFRTSDPGRLLAAAFTSLTQYAASQTHRKPEGTGLAVCGLEEVLAPSVKASNRTRPQSVEESLAQSRQHARLALSEVLRSISCLIDAAALALGAGQNPILDSGWTSLVSAIDEVARKLAGVQESEPQAEGVSEILAALEQEISRWEDRAAHDEHAQAVLIAFVGLREMVWQMRQVRGSTGVKTQTIQAPSRNRSHEPLETSRSERPSPIRSTRVTG